MYKESVLKILTLLISLGVFSLGCSAENSLETGINSSLSLACSEDLKAAYEASLWKVMTIKPGVRCTECHSQKGEQNTFPIADSDIDLAFSAFHNPNSPRIHIANIKKNMTNFHQGAGDLQESLVDQAIAIYDEAVPAFVECYEALTEESEE